jgi:hypothetical protein
VVALRNLISRNLFASAWGAVNTFRCASGGEGSYEIARAQVGHGETIPGIFAPGAARLVRYWRWAFHDRQKLMLILFEQQESAQ